MKKFFVVLSAAVAAWSLNAAIPAPSLDIQCTGGNFSAIKDVSANKCKVSVASKEKLAWAEENGEKILSFSGENKQPRGVLVVAPPPKFEINKGFTLYFRIKTAADHNQKVRNQLFQYGYGADKISGFCCFLFWHSFHVRYGSDAKTTVATPSKAKLIKPGTWYDVVMVYDGKTIALYLNGKLAAKPAAAAIPEIKRTMFTIGATANRGGGYAFQGLLKNVKLYEKAFTAEEVAQIK